MEIVVEQAQGNTPVTVLRLSGDLDGSNYQDLIDKGQEVQQSGATRLLLDMTDLRYMSSAGLVALHNLALMMQGETPPNPEDGWSAFREVGKARDAAKTQGNVKLLSPQPMVMTVLERTGLLEFFEVYSDRAAALASF